MSELHQAHAVDSVGVFRARLLHRLKQLAAESSREEIVMPVGIFLLLDADNGGDVTAEELVKRFKLLDFESRNVIDFYFVGWSQGPNGLTFDLEGFQSFRAALRDQGIRQFGGNADLILADAHLTAGTAFIDFSEAIRIDLARAVVEGDFPTLGGFLQSITDAADQVRDEAFGGLGPVFQISSRLGLAMAGRSILDFIFGKWGKIIGAKRLEAVAVRNLGPQIALRDL